MKSLSEIEKEISLLKLNENVGLFSDGLDREEPAKGTQSRNKSRLSFLKLYRNYIETSPSEEFCHAEIERLKKLIISLSNTSVPSTFYPKNFTGDPKKYFDQKMGINDIKEKIKTMEFILGYEEV